MKKLLVLAMMALACQAAFATRVPQPTAADPRIREVVYSPSQVYEVTGAYRYTTTIEFQKGETVQYLALGDTIAWQAHPMGRRVLLKPVEPRAVTNLTVVTDRRTYYFRLSAAPPKDKRDAMYLVRFSYPADVGIAVNPDAVRKASAGAAIDNPATRVKLRHCNYSVSGNQNIKLIRACDDGLFTYLEFAKNAKLPAFFAVDPDGNESVVNYRMEGKYVVIERIGSLFTLREGKETLCLFNEDKPFQPSDSLQRTILRNGKTP
ncbi:MAG: P-type conjugative transfer protein VirB9 [Burkholderiales bacterium]